VNNFNKFEHIFTIFATHYLDDTLYNKKSELLLVRHATA